MKPLPLQEGEFALHVEATISGHVVAVVLAFAFGFLLGSFASRMIAHFIG
jgi:hypothetical protein